MPDFTDRVQDAAEQFNRQALTDQLHKTSAVRESRTHCLDCEEPIPQARREKMPGCLRCVDCEAMHENWRAM